MVVELVKNIVLGVFGLAMGALLIVLNIAIATVPIVLAILFVLWLLS